MKKLAQVISDLFSGLTLTPLVILLVVKLAPTNLSFSTLFVLTFAFIFLIPSFVYLFFLKKGIISDLYISKREERPRIHLVLGICVLLSLLLFWSLGEKGLVLYYLRLLFPLFVFFIITLFWKVSFHSLLSNLFVLLVYLYTGKPIFLYMGIILVILVGWSRVRLKSHTVFQVVVGSLLPLLILI